jgi:hypothetical protein
MLRGPGPGTGPAPGRLAVLRAKTQGVTPGFFVKDSAGASFLLKFDPHGLSEMATGADAVAACLYWAAGYNVADNAVYTFTADDLEISSEASLVDGRGARRPMGRADLLRILERVPRQDSRYRALASHILAGRPPRPEYGPAPRRRRISSAPASARVARPVGDGRVDEPRGRTRSQLARHVDDGERPLVRPSLPHRLRFVSRVRGDRQARVPGRERVLPRLWRDRARSDPGLRPFPGSGRRTDLPSIGFIDSETFDPGTWRPEYPNPAFDERTERDIRWGARIVAAFTDEHIHAAVAQGRYSDPRAAAYLARVLIERRDKIVQRWLSAPAPSAGRF